MIQQREWLGPWAACTPPYAAARVAPCSLLHTDVIKPCSPAELLAVSPSALIMGDTEMEAETEARMWDCFAEVFESEVCGLASTWVGQQQA